MTKFRAMIGSHSWRFWLPRGSIPIVLLLFVLALVPRALLLGDFLTVDEAYHWFGRVETFLQALQEGDYARTNIIGHPGVTTLWLGTSGLLMHQTLLDWGWVAHQDANPALYRAFLRFPIGFVSALCVAGAYPLLRELFDKRLALLATLLWATEPFLVAHAQLLHLDALLTSFMSLSLLLAMVAFNQEQVVSWRPFVASAVVGGLAFLTKSPSVLLLPMVGLMVLLGVLRGYQAEHVGIRIAQAVGMVVAWCVVAALVWVALWPAAWVDVIGTVGRVVHQAQFDGGSPHGWGNFFMGRTVEDPGPLFYPVAIVLRLTPWTLIGLVAAGVVAVMNLAQRRKDAKSIPTLGMLALFAVLFVGMMTIPPKKFDRYVLPMFPILTIVAAFGLVRLYEFVLVGFSKRLPETMKAYVPWGMALVVVVLMLNVLWYHPYELAYYNPLLGGGKKAVQAIPVGWGEGYEQAGAFISAQPNGCDRAVASWFAPVLSRYLCNHWVVSLDRVFEPGKVDYAVLYIDQIQRNNKPEATAFLLEHYPRIHTVWIHDIAYAFIYQLPLPNAHRVFADFGPSIRLLGYDEDSSSVRASSVLTLTLQWMTQTPVQEDYMLFVHVFDSQGNRVAQIDVPPGGPHAPTSRWKVHGYTTWMHPVPLPADIPSGRYWVSLGVYDPDTLARLPVHGVERLPGVPDDGANTLFLEPIVLF